MEGKRYLLIDEKVLPKVFPQVLQTKQLLENGKAMSVSEAIRMTGISRGAFYKYRDFVYPYKNAVERSVVTIHAVLSDKPGVLMAFVSVFHTMGANILTVNQNIPVNGRAVVSISARTDAMAGSMEKLIEKLKQVEGTLLVDSISNPL